MTDPQILDVLKNIDRKQDRLIERLFGDLDIENPKARFPQLELLQADVETRVRSLEKDRIRIFTITSILASVVGYCVNYCVRFFHH